MWYSVGPASGFGASFGNAMPAQTSSTAAVPDPSGGAASLAPSSTSYGGSASGGSQPATIQGAFGSGQPLSASPSIGPAKEGVNNDCAFLSTINGIGSTQAGRDELNSEITPAAGGYDVNFKGDPNDTFHVSDQQLQASGRLTSAPQEAWKNTATDRSGEPIMPLSSGSTGANVLELAAEEYRRKYNPGGDANSLETLPLNNAPTAMQLLEGTNQSDLPEGNFSSASARQTAISNFYAAASDPNNTLVAETGSGVAGLGLPDAGDSHPTVDSANNQVTIQNAQGNSYTMPAADYVPQSHDVTVTNVDKKNGMVEWTNPYDPSVTHETPVGKFLDSMSNVYVSSQNPLT